MHDDETQTLPFPDLPCPHAGCTATIHTEYNRYPHYANVVTASHDDEPLVSAVFPVPDQISRAELNAMYTNFARLVHALICRYHEEQREQETVTFAPTALGWWS